MKCRICGSENIKSEIYVREMMIPTREIFEYFECMDCHCLQIKDIPGNLESYYGSNYYSFQETAYKDLNSLKENRNDNSDFNMIPVLDVGCGSGMFLNRLKELGYCNLTGCDPFIMHDLKLESGIQIYKKTIHEMSGKYDMIFMNDSFEHMTDPHEVMESIRRLLSPIGMARISIPIYPNIAYDLFGTDWCQLDAPRHIFLQSRESMEYLINSHGMMIEEVTYNSDPAQIYRSYLYSENIPFWEQKISMFIEMAGEKEFEEIAKLTCEANDNEYGDHAVFLVKLI